MSDIRLQVGKWYRSANGNTAKVVYENNSTDSPQFIAQMDDGQTLHVYSANGVSLHRDVHWDFVSEAPMVVDVWFCVSLDGSTVHSVSLSHGQVLGNFKLVGPVKVEVPR